MSKPLTLNLIQSSRLNHCAVKHIVILACAVLGLNSSVMAAPSGYLPGASLTLGAVSNPYSLSSLMYNPASAATMLRPGEHVRFGWLSSFGTNAEYGNISNFDDEIDRLADSLDADSLGLSEAESLVNDFNSILPILGRDGYLKINAGGSLPVMPAVFRFSSLPGTFFIEGGTEILIGSRFLDSPVEVQINGAEASIITQSSMYLKSGTNLRIGVGYAQSVWSGGEGLLAGELIVGSKLDVHNLSLSKQVIALSDVDDVGDAITDDYDTNELSSTGVSLSLGAIWRADRYQIGFTVNNINEPEFDFGSLGTNCDALSGASQTNCFQAAAFAANGRLDLTEVHTMWAYSTIDGGFFITPNFMVGASLDLGEREDFVGDDHQWLSLSAIYQPKHWAIPGVRAGFRQNQVGSELSSVTFGFTLFRNANIDMEYGLESTEIDGSSAPRSFAINFGFEEHF